MLQWDFSYSYAEIWENVTEVKFCVIIKLLFWPFKLLKPRSTMCKQHFILLSYCFQTTANLCIFSREILQNN